MNSTKMNDTDAEHLFDCSVLNSVGIYCVIVMSIALVSNIILIWILLKHKKELLKNLNILILIVSLLSLIGTFFGFPILIATCFKCRYNLFLKEEIKIKFEFLDIYLEKLDVGLKHLPAILHP